MSLFPAYETVVDAGSAEPSASQSQHLPSCSSFPADLQVFNESQSKSSARDIASSDVVRSPDVAEGLGDVLEDIQDVFSADKKRKKRRSRSYSASPPPYRSSRHKNKKLKKTKDKKSKSRKREEQALQCRSDGMYEKTDDLLASRGTFLEAHDLRPERAFYMDRKADRANMAFPVMYYKNAAYFDKRGKVLGRPSTHRSSFGVNRSNRYFCRAARKTLRCAVAAVNEIVAHVNADVKLMNGTLFIPLAGSAVDQGDVVESQESPQQAEMRRYNQRLSQNPTDVDLWVDFIDAQSRLLGSAGVVLSQLCERQLAIADRALASCPGSKRLHLVRLGLLEQLATAPEQLLAEWKKLLVALPNQTDVWQQYLSFERRRSGFSVGGCVAAFGRCLQRMRQFQQGVLLSHRAPDNLPQFMLHVLRLLCLMLRDAGFTERAVAIYQAMLELNLHEQPIDGMPFADRLVAMETFWDGRLARIGERGARGWRLELLAGKERVGAEVGRAVECDVDRQSADGREEAILESAQLERSEKWLQLELLRESGQWLPWELAGQEDECEDPDRIVSFDDIKQFLFFVPAEHHGNVVLNFSRLLLANISSPTAVSSPSDDAPFAGDDDDDGCCFGVDAPVEEDVGTSRLQPCVQYDRPSVLEFVDRLLQQSWPLVAQPGRCRLQRVWLRLQLDAARCSNGAGALSKALDSGRRKRVKALLREERTSVPLFVEYAALQPAGDAAVRMLEVTLSELAASVGGADSGQTGSQLRPAVRFSLVRRICRLHAVSTQPDRRQVRAAALSALCSLNPLLTTAESAADQLRLVSWLRGLAAEAVADSRLLTAAEARLTADLVSCLAWSLVLTGQSLVAASAAFSNAAQSIDITDRQLSYLFRAQYEFIEAAGTYLSATTAAPLSATVVTASLGYRRLIQAALASAVARCPRDPLLAALAATHWRQPWWKSLKRCIDGDAIVSPLLSWAAVCRRLCSLSAAVTSDGGAETSAAELARLRRTVARLIEQHAELRHRPDVWAVALLLQRLDNPKGVELLWYRAIQACPWSKRLYLFMADINVRRCCHLMSKSGIRVRVPPEELELLLEVEPEQAEDDAEREEAREEVERPRPVSDTEDESTSDVSESDFSSSASERSS